MQTEDNNMEIDRYCNDCLGYYSYDVDETDNFKNVVGVVQRTQRRYKVVLDR